MYSTVCEIRAVQIMRFALWYYHDCTLFLSNFFYIFLLSLFFETALESRECTSTISKQMMRVTAPWSAKHQPREKRCDPNPPLQYAISLRPSAKLPLRGSDRAAPMDSISKRPAAKSRKVEYLGSQNTAVGRFEDERSDAIPRELWKIVSHERNCCLCRKRHGCYTTRVFQYIQINMQRYIDRRRRCEDRE